MVKAFMNPRMPEAFKPLGFILLRDDQTTKGQLIQPFILLRSIKLVPEVLGNISVVKS